MFGVACKAQFNNSNHFEKVCTFVSYFPYLYLCNILEALKYLHDCNKANYSIHLIPHNSTSRMTDVKTTNEQLRTVEEQLWKVNLASNIFCIVFVFEQVSLLQRKMYGCGIFIYLLLGRR